MFWLKQSTTVTVNVGPFLDSLDGYTAETGLSPTVKLSKNGGTLAARNSATAITHDADGYYKVELNTTDTNTLGRLRATVAGSSTALPVWEDFIVLPANTYDSLVAGTDNLDCELASVLAAAGNVIADRVLLRNSSNAEASSDGDAKDFRSLLGAIAKLTNKISISGSTLTITESDDATTLGTQTLTTDAAANPVTGADTA